MKEVSETKPAGVKYVIVLTKADKNIKGPNSTNAGKLSKDVLEKVKKAIQNNNVAGTPVVLTSAETKLGCDDIWRYLRTAASKEVVRTASIFCSALHCTIAQT
jgi:GTP-binding protein EngB required for normal cell division